MFYILSKKTDRTNTIFNVCFLCLSHCQLHPRKIYSAEWNSLLTFIQTNLFKKEKKAITE